MGRNAECRHQRMSGRNYRKLGQVQLRRLFQIGDRLFNGFPLRCCSRFRVQSNIAAFFCRRKYRGQFHGMTPAGKMILSLILAGRASSYPKAGTSATPATKRRRSQRRQWPRSRPCLWLRRLLAYGAASQRFRFVWRTGFGWHKFNLQRATNCLGRSHPLRDGFLRQTSACTRRQ